MKMNKLQKIALEYSKKYHKSYQYSLKKVMHYNLVINKRKRLR